MAAPLTLLPGLMCDARIFADQSRQFPDARAWEGYGLADSLTAMAQLVLDAGPARMSLLGHSMGARVALEMYRLAPERIERLALVSTGTHPVRPGEAAKRHALLDLGHSQGIEALVDSWLPPMVGPDRQHDTALMIALRRMCVAVGVDACAAQIRALLSRPGLNDLLPAITCPTLIAVGDADAWSPPSQHQAIAAAIPGGRVSVVTGSGHMLPAEQPAALNSLIETWLAMPCQ